MRSYNIYRSTIHPPEVSKKVRKTENWLYIVNDLWHCIQISLFIAKTYTCFSEYDE